ncbi:hypothetical protein H6P81_008619 [Aristolochia fimbriata]|uniref:Uncharacterized protein n=1 Tax=Aristolochia fimbriata TaxID=158543 RepID=A0AAV7EJ89_ARIFI|nr:hypothetical protein H6P81_008619 [Aristolochia fimbriata]
MSIYCSDYKSPVLILPEFGISATIYNKHLAARVTEKKKKKEEEEACDVTSRALPEVGHGNVDGARRKRMCFQLLGRRRDISFQAVLCTLHNKHPPTCRFGTALNLFHPRLKSRDTVGRRGKENTVSGRVLPRNESGGEAGDGFGKKGGLLVSGHDDDYLRLRVRRRNNRGLGRLVRRMRRQRRGGGEGEGGGGGGGTVAAAGVAEGAGEDDQGEGDETHDGAEAPEEVGQRGGVRRRGSGSADHRFVRRPHPSLFSVAVRGSRAGTNPDLAYISEAKM